MGNYAVFGLLALDDNQILKFLKGLDVFITTAATETETMLSLVKIVITSVQT